MAIHFAASILDVRYANSRPARACESTFARSVRELEEPHLHTGAKSRMISFVDAAGSV